MASINEDRMKRLLRLVDDGTLHFAAEIDGRFVIKATPTASSKSYTGSQVEALLYGIRVGKLGTETADRPLVSSSQEGTT